MPIPDPQTFFGKKCVIRLKKTGPVTRMVKTIDTTGVLVELDDGTTETIPFANIDRMHLAK